MTNKNAINIKDLTHTDKSFNTLDEELNISNLLEAKPSIPTALIIEGIDGVGKTTFIEELYDNYPLMNSHNSETTIETFADNITDLSIWKHLHTISPSIYNYPYRRILYAIDRWYLSGFVYQINQLDLRWNNIFRVAYKYQIDYLYNLNQYVDKHINLKLYIEPCWECYLLSDRTKHKLKSSVSLQLYNTEEEDYLARLHQLDASYKHYINIINKRIDTIPYLIVNQHDLIFAKVIIKGLLVNRKFNSDLIIEMNKQYQVTKEHSFDILSCEEFLNLYGKMIRKNREEGET